jgi:large subunit ribosomal protein L17
LKSKEAVSELFRDVAPKIADRPGGYTRIIKTGYRLGDDAEMCLIELVDFNTLYGNAAEAAAPKKRTRRGGAAKKKSEGAEGSDAAEEAAEKPKATRKKKSDDAAE